jgi:hypothetical protein
MGGTEGIRLVPVAAGVQGDSLSRLLLNGAVLRGRIAAEGSLLNLIVAGQRIPLPKNILLPPGTAVEVRLAQGNGGPQLRLQVLDDALPAPAPPRQAFAATGPAPKLPAVVLPPALSALITPAQAALLLPNAAAIPLKALEALLTVFVARSEVGRALARLISLLEADIAGGRLPEESAAPLRAAAEALDAESPEEFRRAIEIARETLSARSDQGGPASTARGLIEELGRVREQLAARSGTPGGGRAGNETLKTLDGVVEQLKSSGLQNIRAFETPYQFFAIPFAPRTGIEHAQVHLLGADGRGSGGGAGRRAHLVAIDLYLTHLGPVWITLQSSGASCSCVIRAEHEAVRRALDEGSPALEAGLRRAGFSAAQVRTEPWDADRVEAAAALLSRVASFEAEA